MKRILFNNRVIMTLVLLNAVAIFLQESGLHHPVLRVVDYACTVLFVVEMVLKIRELGMRGYWKRGWNVLDGTVTLLSLPSLAEPFLPDEWMNVSFLLTLRALRLLKLLRAGRYFPNVNEVFRGLVLALRRSAAFMLAFVLLIVIFAIINCSLFGEVAPQYFATPLDSVYSVFRLFTVEGWYDIPDAVTATLSPVWSHMVRIYFCLLLIGGGIIGMSLINSIFVDAMVADNNDDVKEQLRRIEEKLDRLEKKD